MGHCAYSELADLEDILTELRTWDSVRERSPGVFYVKTKPFLHFHSNRSGERWADARRGLTWGPQLAIPPGADAVSRRAFRERVREYYEETVAALAPKARKTAPS